jgi:hypothetical protein
MTEQTYSIGWSAEGARLGMQSLWRLAIWGVLAAVALFTAVISAFSNTGAQRSAAAATASQLPAQQAASQQAASIEMQQRSFAAEVRMQLSNNTEETRRLSDAVHALSADSQQLSTRMATVEHNLEGVTGSIKRDRAPNVAPTPPTPQAPPARPEAPMATSSIPSTASAVPAPPPPAPEVKLAVIPPAGAPPAGQSEEIKNSGSDAANRAMASASAETASGLGVDVGGAANFDALRTLWHSTKNNDPSLLDDFYPLVATRENSKTHAAELRLIIGPMPDAEAAAQLCVTLASAHQYCQPVAFEGQRLAVADAGKGMATHRRAPPPAPPIAGLKVVPAYPAGK